MRMLPLLAIGVVAIAAVGEAGGWKAVGEVMDGRRAGRTSIKGICKIKKPLYDKCGLWTDQIPPYCNPIDCDFVPQYGEEISNFWEIWFPWLSNKKQKKYRQILDLGEEKTKSHEGVVCETENVVCDCKEVDDCTCTADDAKVCKQKYKYKYGFYWVLNAYYCARAYDPWHYFWKMIKGDTSHARHLTSVETHAGPPNFQYDPRKQNPSWQYILHYIMPLLKKEKSTHLGELVPCGEQPKGRYGYPKPTQPNHFNNYYNLDMNMLVKHTFLKIKVPVACECEDL